jgi:hypothetical protein
MYEGVFSGSTLCTGQIRRKTETQSLKAKILKFRIMPVGPPEGKGRAVRPGVTKLSFPKILLTKANPSKDGDAKLRD